MSIGQGIAEMHGGSLTLVSSRPGHTEFRVSLPTTPGTTPPSAPTPAVNPGVRRRPSAACRRSVHAASSHSALRPRAVWRWAIAATSPPARPTCPHLPRASPAAPAMPEEAGAPEAGSAVQF